MPSKIEEKRCHACGHRAVLLADGGQVQNHYTGCPVSVDQERHRALALRARDERRGMVVGLIVGVVIGMIIAFAIMRVAV